MERKLIFFDIDGTLTADLSAPSPAVRRAIQKTRAQGHLVFLCTGRNLPIIGAELLEIGFDGVIASAGSYVSAGERVLFEHLLSESVVQECLEVFHGQGMFCRIETPEGIYTDPQMEQLLRSASPDPRNSELIRMQKEIEVGIFLQKYEDYPRKGAYKLCFTSTDLASVRKAEERLGDRFDFAVHLYGNTTSCYNGEITPKGIDKGDGMVRICEYYGADLKDTIAFGDSINDAPMLRRAGLAIAMGNACDELKAMAHRVCESVEQDGVCLELARLGLYQ